MSVDPVTAAWLKSPYSTVSDADATVAGIWGALATESEAISSLADRTTAIAEAARQMAFLTHPSAPDRVLVPGLRADLLGKLIDATTDRGGMTAARCLVIGVEEQADVETTILTVLRKLA